MCYVCCNWWSVIQRIRGQERIKQDCIYAETQSNAYYFFRALYYDPTLMDFDGSTQWVNLGPNAVIQTTNFTCTAWVNIDDLTGSDQHGIITLNENDSPFGGVVLYIKRGTDPGRIGTYNAGLDFSAAVAVTANQWDLAAIRGLKAAPTIETIALLGSWGTGTTHTAEAGSDRLLVFIASHESVTDNIILDTVTYGTESLTLVGRVEVDDITNGHIEMWQLNEAGIAAASSGTFVPTWSAGITDVIYTHAFFSNVDQATPTGTTQTATRIAGTVVHLEDAFTTSPVNNTDWNHADPAGSNRLLVAYFSHNDGGTDDTMTTAPTYGGQTMTLIGTATVGTAPYNRVYMWYLNEAGIASAGASINISFVWDAAANPDRQVHASAFFENVDQTTPVGGFATRSLGAGGNTIDLASAITIADGDMVVSVAGTGSTTSWTADNEFHEGFDDNNSSSTTAGSFKVEIGSSLNPQMTKVAGGNRMVLAAVRINHVGGITSGFLDTSSITASNNEMIVVGAMNGNTTVFNPPKYGFTDGSDASGSSSRVAGFHKASTGSEDFPSAFQTGLNRGCIFAAELNQAVTGSGSVDVSVNGGTWTNLITGDTTPMDLVGSDAQQIGRWNGGPDYFTNGGIADVRCYGRQLTQIDIETIFEEKGKDGIVEGLLGRWPLRNGAVGESPAIFVASTATSSTNIVPPAGLVVTVPTNADGDLLIAVICATTAGAAPTVATPAGWSLIDAADLPSTLSTPHLAVFRRPASSEPANYSFVPSVTSGMIGHMLSYRNVATTEQAVDNDSGTSSSPTSPAVSGNDSVLQVRICAVDDNEVPATTRNFFPPGIQNREADETSTPGNGISLGTGDELGRSVVLRTWNPDGSEQWRGLTITFVASGIKDVGGAVGHPHDGLVSGTATYVETILRI